MEGYETGSEGRFQARDGTGIHLNFAAKLSNEAGPPHCPAMARPAPPNSECSRNFERLNAEGRIEGLDMTGLFSMVGQCPALSVPSGMTAAGLPTAVQIVGRRFDDPTVLRIGAAVEKLRPWRQWTPDDLGGTGD